MDHITSRNETYCKNGNTPQQKVTGIFFLASAEFIYQMARSDIEQDHHHANEKLIVIDRI